MSSAAVRIKILGAQIKAARDELRQLYNEQNGLAHEMESLLKRIEAMRIRQGKLPDFIRDSELRISGYEKELDAAKEEERAKSKDQKIRTLEREIKMLMRKLGE